MHRLAFLHRGIDVEDPRLVVQRRVGDLHKVVARVAGVGGSDLADEAGNRSIDLLAGGGVEIGALVAASAPVAPGAEPAAAEVVAAAQVLAGGIGEIGLAVSVDVDAGPDQLFGRRDLGLGRPQP